MEDNKNNYFNLAESIQLQQCLCCPVAVRLKGELPCSSKLVLVAIINSDVGKDKIMLLRIFGVDLARHFSSRLLEKITAYCS